MIYLLIKVGYLIISPDEIIMNKAEDLIDFKHDGKTRTELFIREPLTHFGNMRKIHMLVIGSGMCLPSTLSTLSVANVVVHNIDVENTHIEGDFFTTNKIDWEILQKRFKVSVNTIYQETLTEKSIFDFQKQSKKKMSREDLKSQKLKSKHRRT